MGSGGGFCGAQVQQCPQPPPDCGHPDLCKVWQWRPLYLPRDPLLALLWVKQHPQWGLGWVHWPCLHSWTLAQESPSRTPVSSMCSVMAPLPRTMWWMTQTCWTASPDLIWSACCGTWRRGRGTTSMSSLSGNLQAKLTHSNSPTQYAFLFWTTLVVLGLHVCLYITEFLLKFEMFEIPERCVIYNGSAFGIACGTNDYDKLLVKILSYLMEVA